MSQAQPVSAHTAFQDLAESSLNACLDTDATVRFIADAALGGSLSNTAQSAKALRDCAINLRILKEVGVGGVEMERAEALLKVVAESFMARPEIAATTYDLRNPKRYERLQQLKSGIDRLIDQAEGGRQRVFQQALNALATNYVVDGQRIGFEQRGGGYLNARGAADVMRHGTLSDVARQALDASLGKAMEAESAGMGLSESIRHMLGALDLHRTIEQPKEADTKKYGLAGGNLGNSVGNICAPLIYNKATDLSPISDLIRDLKGVRNLNRDGGGDTQLWKAIDDLAEQFRNLEDRLLTDDGYQSEHVRAPHRPGQTDSNEHQRGGEDATSRFRGRSPSHSDSEDDGSFVRSSPPMHRSTAYRVEHADDKDDRSSVSSRSIFSLSLSNDDLLDDRQYQDRPVIVTQMHETDGSEFEEQRNQAKVESRNVRNAATTDEQSHRNRGLGGARTDTEGHRVPQLPVIPSETAGNTTSSAPPDSTETERTVAAGNWFIIDMSKLSGKPPVSQPRNNQQVWLVEELLTAVHIVRKAPKAVREFRAQLVNGAALHELQEMEGYRLLAGQAPEVIDYIERMVNYKEPRRPESAMGMVVTTMGSRTNGYGDHNFVHRGDDFLFLIDRVRQNPGWRKSTER